MATIRQINVIARINPSPVIKLTARVQGPQGKSSTGDDLLPTDNVFTGINQFDDGIVLPSSDGVLWLVRVNTNGSLQTDIYSGSGTPTDSFLSEDGVSYFITEDSLSYLAQEA